ncbi:hypothetical protein D9M70_546530 [compost metagenome]
MRSASPSSRVCGLPKRQYRLAQGLASSGEAPRQNSAEAKEKPGARNRSRPVWRPIPDAKGVLPMSVETFLPARPFRRFKLATVPGILPAKNHLTLRNAIGNLNGFQRPSTRRGRWEATPTFHSTISRALNLDRIPSLTKDNVAAMQAL